MRFSGTRPSLLFLAAVGLLIVGYGSNALADTATKTVGNQNGTPFKAACPPGNALIGWAYNATDRLTAIAPLCQKVADDGQSVVGDPPSAPESAFGAEFPDAAQGDPMTCPDGGIMRGIQIFLTESLKVHHIRATCKAPNHAPELIKPTITNGGTSTANSTVKCETGTSYARGLIGNYSKSLATGGIMSLGLLCFDGKSDQADTGDNTSPDTDKTTPPPDTGDNDTADTGDDNVGITFEININANGITFGPKGKVRVTSDTTTLYSDKGETEIDYFDKGQKVVVVGCENKGKGWCQVIKPKPGLIWGGDLK